MVYRKHGWLLSVQYVSDAGVVVTDTNSQAFGPANRGASAAFEQRKAGILLGSSAVTLREPSPEYHPGQRLVEEDPRVIQLSCIIPQAQRQGNLIVLLW